MSRRHTWSGLGEGPTYEKLDRVLVSIEWENKFQGANVEAQDRSQSDHTPLLLNTCSLTHTHEPPLFKFERGWLIQNSFVDMVANIWQSENKGDTLIERWKINIRHLRQYLKGWAEHTIVQYRKKRKTSSQLLKPWIKGIINHLIE